MPEPRRHKTGWPSTTSAARYNASLLDAPSVKGALQAAQAPLVLVVSAGLDGFVHTGESGRAFSPVSVQVAAAVRGRAERPDYQPVLNALRAPALVCAGDHDSYSTAEITSELTGCLPDPEVVVMEGVGHLPNLERPDAFNTHLLRFLTSALP